jgi:hypothetical protein
MKKSTLFWSFVILAVFPAYLGAQEIQLPTVEIRVNQDLVPAKVKDAVLNDFGVGHKPIEWVNSNTIFNASQWTQRSDVNTLDIHSYSLRVKTDNGCSLDAFYTADGKLINSREYLKNFKPSQEILMTIQNSEYKDWGISKDFHLIKISSTGSSTERLGFVMKKGKEKKTVYFDENNRILAVESGDHGELADLDR